MAEESLLPPYKTSLAKQYDVYPFVDPTRYAGQLKGKVVVITGANVGIGKATAHAFAAAGASVVCVARRQELLDAVVKELKEKYQVPAIAIAADLLDDPSATAKKLVEKTEAALGPIDVLVNNAGVFDLCAFAEDTISNWWRNMRLNIEVPTALIHAVLPSMLARKTGFLINLGSTAGAFDGGAMQTMYCTSKAAMQKFHHVLEKELVNTGIYTFTVHPGNVWTDMVQGGFQKLEKEHPEALKAMQESNNPYVNLKWQKPELAAGTIVALCAEERCRVLTGRYIDAEQDLEEIIKAGESGRVERERLYLLKVEEL